MTEIRPFTVDTARGHFLRGDRPAFQLADTVWAAFTRPSVEEWAAWIRRRARQGFNAVNISILPIGHDRSLSSDAHAPFLLTANGEWDLDAPDPAYFARARAFAAMAAEAGIVPILVVLWCNYAPGTWGAALTPELVMTQEQTDRYVALVLETFTDLAPVYCVSGDDRFDAPEATDRYRRAAAQIRAAAPGCLVTMHPTTRGLLPAELADSDLVDYYSFQSGHDAGWDERAASLAVHYRGLRVRRPVVSMEPCYEGHGIGGQARHSAAAVRQASWTAVLSGAGAGLGYGAHGLWSWHRPGDTFNGEHFSGMPFPADVALEFDGAWDVSLLRRLVEAHDLYDLRAAPELLIDDVIGTRIGVQDDPRRIAVWVPQPFAVRLGVDLGGWDAVCVDLAHRRVDRAVLRTGAGRTVIAQPDFLGDALYVFSR